MTRIEKTEKVVASFAMTNTSVKWVLTLEGLHDDGKTSTLKTLIRLLHDRDPQSLVGKYDASRVVITGEKCESEYSATIIYKGVIVVIRTGGDNASVICKNFSAFAHHSAVVGIMALKARTEGEKETGAVCAYRKIVSQFGVQERIVDIRGLHLRTEAEEVKVAEEIIKELDLIVAQCNK